MRMRKKFHEALFSLALHSLFCYDPVMDKMDIHEKRFTQGGLC